MNADAFEFDAGAQVVQGRATVETFTLVGIEAVSVEVQVSVDSGYPQVSLVGLPDTSVRESRDRISAAFRSSGLRLPDRHVTVNLAPAELRKEGSGLDLPIALGILVASGQIPAEALHSTPVSGELALDGSVRAVRGALSMALAAEASHRRRLMLPEANLSEAASVGDLRFVPVASLSEIVAALNGGEPLTEVVAAACSSSAGEASTLTPEAGPTKRECVDLARIRGQAGARRALEIAAAGGHNLLFVGPPGAGKSLLAQALPGILPRLDPREALEATVVHSVAGLLAPGSRRLNERPFRAPHHTITGAGLVGGGAWPRPGEISLAHRGVLFLDELPEFRGSVLDLLRQPLEEGFISLVRAGRSVRLPCRFQLVAAMNPCPCGFTGHPRRACRCTPHQVASYQGRIGGPLLDRLDLHVDAPPVTAQELMQTNDERSESSATVRARVEAARELQRARFADREGVFCNAQMGLVDLERHVRLAPKPHGILHAAADRFSLSARAVHRSLRVARTIADLAASEEIEARHVIEAVGYRMLDRGDRKGGV